MERRELVVAIGSVCSTAAIAGCTGGDEIDNQEENDNSDSGDDSPSSTDQAPTDNEESCRTELKSKSETIVDRTRDIEGGYEWTHGYRSGEGDTVHFDISASSGQDVAVEIDSPRGQTVYSESGLSLTTTHRFDRAGTGEVRVTNLGERTKEEREELWDERKDVSAGRSLAPWVEISEGNAVDYYIRKIDGARPKLRIEDSSGRTVREHSVSAVIDDKFTAPEDGRYYFYLENTATLTTGTWDYTFERVNEIPISTTAELTIEREYEEEVEICD